MFRLVLIVGTVALYGVWWNCSDWTVEQAQNIEQELHLNGCKWFLEYK